MNNSPEQILYRKAALIFEELGFLMPRSDTREYSQTDSTSAMISFKGPSSGCLLVSLTPQLLPLLTSNMLGESGTAGTSLEEDSLCEITSVICGNSLPAIFGFDSVFHIDTPAVLADPDRLLHASKYKKEAHVNISFDEGHATVTLLLEQDPSASA
jgi:CheY-specific phosphatase CheX